MSEIFTQRTSLPVSSQFLADWHFRPGAFQRLMPPWEQVAIVDASWPIVDHARWTMRMNLLGPITTDWVAELYGIEPGVQFRDRQIRGPFASWEHTHRFIADGDSSILEDHVEYRLPFGVLGKLARSFVRQRLQTMFAFRHATTKADLIRHWQFRDRPRLTVAVTGSRGLIGSEFVAFLTAGGHQVVRFVTSERKLNYDDGTTWIRWDPQQPVDPKMLEGVDAVVHLAGDNIAEGRWTASKRARLRESRVTPTRHLANAIAASPSVKLFLSGSAVGFYGDRGDEVLTESSPDGSGFLAEISRLWEQSALPAQRQGCRVVWLRTGIVVSGKGGVLSKQLLPFRIGAGAILGSGQQWLSWIGIDDQIHAMHHLLMTDSIHGPVNLVSPTPVTNREFSKNLGSVLHRPVWFRLPAWFLRIVFGPIADEVFLASLRVSPERLISSGYEFNRTNLKEELQLQLGQSR